MDETKCLICGYANRVGGKGFRVGFVHTECQAELAVLKALVREIRRGLNAYGYSMPKVYEILNRPDVIAILKEAE